MLVQLHVLGLVRAEPHRAGGGVEVVGGLQPAHRPSFAPPPRVAVHSREAVLTDELRAVGLVHARVGQKLLKCNVFKR